MNPNGHFGIILESLIKQILSVTVKDCETTKCVAFIAFIAVCDSARVERRPPRQAPDHTHILVGFRPSISISDLTRDIKSVASKFINEEKLMRFHFNWQDGYGAFTCSHSQITAVVNYIQKQPEHHKKQTFREEYLHFLEKFEIEYDKQYLFDWIN